MHSSQRGNCTHPVGTCVPAPEFWGFASSPRSLPTPPLALRQTIRFRQRLSEAAHGGYRREHPGNALVIEFEPELGSLPLGSDNIQMNESN